VSVTKKSVGKNPNRRKVKKIRGDRVSDGVERVDGVPSPKRDWGKGAREQPFPLEGGEGTKASKGLERPPELSTLRL